jgi:hypothetical protein
VDALLVEVMRVVDLMLVVDVMWPRLSLGGSHSAFW